MSTEAALWSSQQFLLEPKWLDLDLLELSRANQLKSDTARAERSQRLKTTRAGQAPEDRLESFSSLNHSTISALKVHSIIVRFPSFA